MRRQLCASLLLLVFASSSLAIPVLKEKNVNEDTAIVAEEDDKSFVLGEPQVPREVRHLVAGEREGRFIKIGDHAQAMEFITDPTTSQFLILVYITNVRKHTSVS